MKGGNREGLKIHTRGSNGRMRNMPAEKINERQANYFGPNLFYLSQRKNLIHLIGERL